MKIVYLNTLYEPNIRGGAERSVQALAEKMARDGHDVSVLTSAATGDESSSCINGVKVHYLPQVNVYRWPQAPSNQAVKLAWHAVDTYNPMMAAKVRSFLRSQKAEVLHTNTIGGFSAAVWDAARKENVPVVHTLRDYYLLCPKSRMFENGQNCVGQCTPCAAFSVIRKARSQRVRAVVGVSRYTLDRHLKAGYFRHAEIARVVYNIYERPLTQKAEFPAKVGPLRLGYLGQLHPSKGFEQLAEVFTRLPGKEAQLLVAGKGDGEYEAKLRERFAGSRIEFMGFVPPENLLSRIDALVLPALWQEPLPRILFEAYSFGVPVVASRRGGQPEIVEEGKTGFLFEPEDPQEFSAVLSRLTRAECEGMRSHCLEAARNFSADSIAGQYRGIYEEARALQR